ncbi:MAG TPA: UDP binding domain-containing protein, partial [Burkholderiaceae bacterium]
VQVYDPVAMDEARRCLEADLADTPDAFTHVRFTNSPMEAVRGTDALVIVTEWKAFRSPDFDAIKAALKQPVVFDGRNLFEPTTMRDLGIEYFGIGRSFHAPAAA